MKNNNKAIFLGKFQPPHLGHVRTILRVAEQYDRLIVGITQGEPKAIEYSEVKQILQEILRHESNIDVRLIEGTIEGGTSNIADLDFDVVVSGNRKVLGILEKQGYQVAFQPRTEGLGYSGSEIRSLTGERENLLIRNNDTGFDFSIVQVSRLKPLERVFPVHFRNVEKLLLDERIMKQPIIVDAKNYIVLDGSHRYAFLVKYGYKYAPVIKVDYDDESIFVGNHLRHRYLRDGAFVISKSEVINRGVNEKLFPARTTRHFFPFRKKAHPTELSSLEPGMETDIDYLLEDCDIDDEIVADKGYISEIDEELDILAEYIDEQSQVKKYLQYQLHCMETEESRVDSEGVN